MRLKNVQGNINVTKVSYCVLGIDCAFMMSVFHYSRDETDLGNKFFEKAVVTALSPE